MLVSEARVVELAFELAIEDFLEQILEAAVVDLQDGVLRRQVYRVAAVQRIREAGARETRNRRVEIEHAQHYASAGSLDDFVLDRSPAIGRREAELERARGGELKVGGAVLVAEAMTRDHHGLIPMSDQPRHIAANNGLAEDGAIENVADGAVGALPHLLESKFLNAAFIRRDGGALDGDAVLLRGVGGIDGDLVAGFVALLDGKVKVLEVDIEVGEDEAFADPLPDDTRHLVAVHFDNGVLDLDLGHLK